MRGKVVEILKHGERCAKTAAECSDLLGVDRRTFAQMVAEERINGEQILSSGCGYFLPETEDEIAHFLRSMRSRAREIMRAARGVETGGKM